MVFTLFCHILKIFHHFTMTLSHSKITQITENSLITTDPDSFVGWQARSRAAAPSPPVLPSGSTARAMATTTSIPRWITKPAQSSPLLPASNAINQSPMMSLVCLGNDKGKSDWPHRTTKNCALSMIFLFSKYGQNSLNSVCCLSCYLSIAWKSLCIPVFNYDFSFLFVYCLWYCNII